MRLNSITTGALAAALLFSCGRGLPNAVVPSTTIDFGLSKCGGSAPADQIVRIHNQGNAPLNASATLTGSSIFSISGNRSIQIPAGGDGAFTVSAQGVDSSANAGDVIAGTLTIVTDDPMSSAIRIPVQLAAQGGSLMIGPKAASFGLVKVGSHAPAQPISIKNSGNAPVKLSFVQPEDSQFALARNGPVTLGAGEEAILPAQFAPARTQASASTAKIMTDDTLCGGGSTSIAFTGQGSNGDFGMSPADLYFGPNKDGLVDCGLTAFPVSFELFNYGNGAYNWTSALSGGANSRYVLSPDHGIIRPGEAMVVTVTSAAIPQVSAIDSELYSESLHISTDIAGDVDHQIRLHQSARGAIVVVRGAPVDFGIIPINTMASAPIQIQNKGNARISLGMTPTSPLFDVQPGRSLAIPAFSNTSVSMVFAPGQDISQQNATLQYWMATNDAICSPLPQALSIRGSGGIGRASFSATALDFGAVDCGTTAASQTVVVSNTGNLAFSVAAKIESSSARYSVQTDAENGLVAPNSSVRVTVTPAQIPVASPITPDFYDDQLTITTNIPGDKGHAIQLRESARGAILNLSASTLAFGGTPVGNTNTFQYTVTNTGNSPATFNVVSMSGSNVFQLPQSVTVAPGSSVQSLGTFRPAAAQDYSDIGMIVPVGSTVCQAAGASMALSGTGTNSQVVDLYPNQLNFGTNGYVPCGRTGRPQSVRITNTSAQTINVTLALGKGADSPFALGQSSASIDPGNQMLVNVTPRAIPHVASTSADFFGDTLTITTDAAGDAPHTVGLHQTALGAVLSFERATIRFSATERNTSSTQLLRVFNTGNSPVVFASLLSNPDQFSVQPQFGNFGASTWFEGNIVFHPDSSGMKRATIDVNSSSVLCAPLPTTLSLEGIGL